MVKLFIRNVNEVPLRNLTECIRNKKKMSKSWLCGFELATNHDCSHASNFSMGKIFEKCAKIVRIASSKVKHVNFIVIHSVTSFDAAQKGVMDELSNGILHE